MVDLYTKTKTDELLGAKYTKPASGSIAVAGKPSGTEPGAGLANSSVPKTKPKTPNATLKRKKNRV